MSVPIPQMTYRTIETVSSEPMTKTMVSAAPISPVSYGVNGSYETVRYLVPVQRAVQQSYVMMPQAMPQMMQQVVSPMYLQPVSRLSVSSQEGSDVVYRQQCVVENVSGKSSVFSQSSSPVKSPEPSAEEEEEEEEEEVEVEEVEIINVIQQKPVEKVTERVFKTETRREVREIPQPTKMDTRFFGELLAEVYRKNCDIHSCISEHVAKIRGRKHQLDPSNDYKMEREEVEALIPKGATELTKQQIRYLLQTRLTADKSMRLLLSTFSSLREELIHMSDDLRRLESEKESLERDLSFKDDQAQQYDRLLEAVRENNRQLQLSLKESTVSQRTLESQLMSSLSTDSGYEFKIKELQGRLRVLEKENEILKQKQMSHSSNSLTLQTKTEELSRQYSEQLSILTEDKDKEIGNLRSQLMRIQTEVSTERSSLSSSQKSLQLRITELLAMLEQRQSLITRHEEEIRQLKQENESSRNQVTKTIITKKYRNQYPILGLLSDDFHVTSPVKEAKTIVIERSGEMIKQE
ncbi:protein POF1B isoform X2 [Lampris incognitus]|uniref:protein POF1B isoform X2 n=1 Tax=Lampris incognitus TaxID=2546036 RepID=UPI0024B48B16|nr:protein POF1B isoform X2 [Lampris incognitus]